MCPSDIQVGYNDMQKILCIEDEASLRADIADELTEAGYEVIEAANGKDGIEKILRYRPDLILCDIHMPILNGFEVLSEIRENHKDYADIPFVFLSAYTHHDFVLSGLDSGADDYLTKPVDFSLMRSKVRASLRQVERMEEKNEKEMVKLYKSFQVSDEGSSSIDNKAVQNSVTAPSAFFVGSDISSIHRHMSDIGYVVTFFSKVEEFLSRLNIVQPDIVVFGTDVKDMSVQKAIHMARNESQAYFVLILPENSLPDVITTHSKLVEDLLILPCNEKDMTTRVRQWQRREISVRHYKRGNIQEQASV